MYLSLLYFLVVMLFSLMIYMLFSCCKDTEKNRHVSFRSVFVSTGIAANLPKNRIFALSKAVVEFIK